FARLRGSVDCSLIGLKSPTDDHRQKPDHDISRHVRFGLGRRPHFGAFALALVVRPVPGRALLLGGNSVATASVTGWPRGDRADKDLCRSSSRSIANKVLPSSAAASPSSRRPPNDHRPTAVTFDPYDRVAPHWFVNRNA